MQLSPAANHPLVGFARLSEDLPEEASDRIGFFAPSLALVSLASEVFASSGAREAVSFSDYPLTTFRSPSEYARLGAVNAGFLLQMTASLAVLSPTTLTEAGSHIPPERDRLPG